MLWAEGQLTHPPLWCVLELSALLQKHGGLGANRDVGYAGPFSAVHGHCAKGDQPQPNFSDPRSEPRHSVP